MRIPQDRPSGPQPPGRRTYEEDLSLRYLSPGAFTVLPPGRDRHDPPPAPQPYRLTPNSRRRREQAFSIIAEPTSNPGSRSPSPSGRVSPFRGRGFNPAGSRHASPAPSPPPHAKTKPPAPHHQHQPRSKIPKLTRRGSEQYFGDRISPPEDARLSPKPLSQSMTNLTETSRRRRPPQSPRRKPPPFQQLSPIVGSSPEAGGEKGVRAGRSRSGGDSPGRVGGSPARKVGTGYKNVQAKVNSYSRMVGKPKVPVKPEGLVTTGNTDSSTSTEQGNRIMKNRTPVSSRKNEKPQLTRRESDKKLNAQKNNSNTNNQNNNNNNKSSSSNNKNNNTNNNNINNKTYSKIPTSNGNNSTNNNNGTTTTNNNNKTSNLKNSESVTKLSDLLPSTTTVVSTTTTTVTKPLKIDANVEERLKMTTNGEKVAPIVDGRILSATSVSNAINRMNDTVLDSQTVIKEHNFSKLSPAASAIISLSNEEYKTKTLESRQKGSDGLTGQQKTVGGGGGGVGVNGGSEMGSKVTGNNSNGSSFSINSNNTSMSGTDRQNVAVRQNSNHTGMTNTLNHGSSTVNVMGQGTVVAHGNMGNNNHKIGMSNNNSIERNQRHMETRNVIAADVQPLRITVKEKAPNVEVQSGNIRYPGPTANGISEIPSLPPPEPDNPQSEPQKPKNCCSRFFTGCRRKLPCGCCQKPKSASEKKLVDRNEDKKQTGCFTCTKGTKEDAERVKDATKKSSCWDRIKCCGKNKVGDKMTGCCPRGKRRTSWIDQREQQENLEQEAASKRCCSCCNKKACGGFFRRMFCCCCKKKKMEDPVSRRESMLSKKKSLSSTVPPPEMKPKLDLSLVEHASHMKGAIPVLPVKLAWFCLICNIFLPGIGTIFSGMFCLCIGIPRFSQKDGPKPRIGAFIIDLIIGCGQLFTVLFCLVGWGWSIWWGLIMLKIAKKHQKLLAQEDDAPTSLPANQHHQMRDVERGAT